MLLSYSAILLGLASTLFTAKRHTLAWPIGIAGVLCYAVIFWRDGLYINLGLNLVYLLQSIYGWYNWATKPKDEEGLVETSRLPRMYYLPGLAVVLAAGLGLGALFGSIVPGYPDPYLDAFGAAFSLAANWLTTRRLIENWPMWIVGDSLYIALYIKIAIDGADSSYYGFAALFAFYLAVAAWGWKKWLEDEKKSYI